MELRIEVPGPMDKESIERLRADWEKMWQGDAPPFDEAAPWFLSVRREIVRSVTRVYHIPSRLMGRGR